MTFQEVLILKEAISNALDWISTYSDHVCDDDEDAQEEVDAILEALEESIELIDDAISKKRP